MSAAVDLANAIGGVFATCGAFYGVSGFFTDKTKLQNKLINKEKLETAAADLRAESILKRRKRICGVALILAIVSFAVAAYFAFNEQPQASAESHRAVAHVAVQQSAICCHSDDSLNLRRVLVTHWSTPYINPYGRIS